MASSKFQEGMHGVFGRISHYRAWVESHITHSSNHFCDGGLDARDIQPKCECGGLDGVEVSTHRYDRVAVGAIFHDIRQTDLMAYSQLLI